jgi:hypothetical protein
MKKTALIIGIVMVLLVPAVISYAGHWHGHGGWGWGGGIYIGPGYYPGPYYYPYAQPYYYPYPAYPANCETRCYKQVVPTCSTDENGQRTCRDEVVRSCRKYCY